MRLSQQLGLAVIGSGLSVFATPALAQSSESAGPGDIIVTARRTEERLQDVPISITVFNQEQISNRNIVTATDLGTYTPSLTVNQRFGPEKASFVIRGFVQENATAPSVGVYFADVTAPRAQGGTQSGNIVPVGSFMDLQNVQVLKGPQGTLFGRNTTGGAVLLVPQKPTDKLEGYVEGSTGNYNMWRLQGVLNIPLADTFKVRLGMERNKRDGYMKNHSGIGPDTYNDVNYFAARLSIVADLTPDLENYTIATYSHSFANGYGSRIVICDRTLDTPGNVAPVIASSAALARTITGSSACEQLDRQNARGDSLLDVEISNPDSRINIRQWQVINTTTWQASDNLRIKNIVSYTDFRETDAFSLYGDNFTVSTPAPIFNGRAVAPAGSPYAYIQPHQQAGTDQAPQSTFTEELQFQGTSLNGQLNWQAGGYLEISDPLRPNLGYSANLLNCSDVPNLVCANPLGIGSLSDSARWIYFRNKGVYAQGTYKLTEQLSLTGGIRYTWDKVRAIASDTRLRPAAGGGYTRTCNDTVTFPSTPVTSREQCRVVRFAKSSRPTWLIDLDYKPSDDMLLYVKWARGYRQGGVNPTNIGLESWGPEKVDTYEVGAKTSFGGGVRGYFNIAGFYNDFSDQQINISAISNVAGFAGSQPIANAGKSRIWGIEADGSVTLFDSLRLDAGYTYLDTKVLKISLPSIPAGAPYSQLISTAEPGDPLALSPKHRLTLTGTYTLPLDESIGKISFGATYIYTSDYVFTKATVAQYRTLPATNLVNLNLNWDNFLGQPVDLAAFVTNVTNEIYPTSVGSAYNSAGFESISVGLPRMWGARLRYRFGD